VSSSPQFQIAMIDFPPFRLDPDNQCLWRRDGMDREIRIEMGPKAFDVLRYLVERAGRLVTQDELLDALWRRAYVQPEVLKSQVLNVRQALNDNPKAPKYIETVPRRGYRFIAPIAGAEREPGPVVPASQHLVGRDAPLDELQASLRSALDGNRQFVFVTGQAGIGKSALVDEFRKIAVAKWPALRVAIGQCVEGYGGREPYYPFLEAIGELCVIPGGDSVVGILGSVAPTWLVQFPSLLTAEHRATLQREIAGATRERMLRELAEALDRIAERTPLLLLLSDLHWVDHASVDLIAALARRRSPARMLLLGTYRPVDLAFADHPLKRIAQELLAHNLIIEIPLQPLQQSDVARCVRAVAPDDPGSGELAALIQRRSDGNPLFMTALLNDLVSRGVAKREDGVWQLLVPLSGLYVDVPDGIRGMLELRIERLSEEEQRALEAASVIGSSFELEAAAVVAAMTPDRFEDLCERLARQQTMLRADLDNPSGFSYRFAHDLYRDVFYKRQSPARRGRTHLRYAEWLEANAGSTAGDIVPILAYHFEQAASWERAVKYLQIAAEQCVQRIAHREAAELLQQALKRVRNLPPAHSQEMEIRLLKSLCAVLQAIDDLRSIEAYEALVDRSAQYGFFEDQVRGLIGLATATSRVDVNRPQSLLERAIDLAHQIVDPGLQVQLLAIAHIDMLVMQGASAEHETGCRAWIARARPLMNAVDLAPLLLNYSQMLNQRSRHREAVAAVDEALADHESRDSAPHANQIYWGYIAKAESLLFMGQCGSALAWVEEISAILERSGQLPRTAHLRTVRARALVLAEDLDGAERVLKAGRQDIGEGIFVTRPWMAWGALVKARRGDFAGAMKMLVEMDADMERHPLLMDRIFRPIVEWGYLEALLASARLTDAELHVQRFIAASEVLGKITWLGLAWEAGARVALARQSADEAEERLARALLAIEGYEEPHAAWRIHARIADLQDSRGSFEVAREHRRESAGTLRALAESLPAGHPTRCAFLSSPAVRHVLDKL